MSKISLLLPAHAYEVNAPQTVDHAVVSCPSAFLVNAVDALLMLSDGGPE